MAKTDFQSIDEYLARQPPETQRVLQRVRQTIRRAVPAAQEVISYQIPAFRLPDGLVVFFAGWKEHYSLYPASEQVQKRYRKELAAYEVSKGTIRFPLGEKVPTTLIAGIAKLRAQETIERAQAKALAKAAKKKPRPPARSKPKRAAATRAG